MENCIYIFVHFFVFIFFYCVLILQCEELWAACLYERCYINKVELSCKLLSTYR